MYQAFQREFPLESLKDMPLEKYTNLKKEDSFCYWVESRTTELGSFWGGSSYKFLIYRYNKRPEAGDSRVVSDDKYAWYTNLGKKTAEEAYEFVRNEIVKVATLAAAGDFDSIDSLDTLGHSYKWKIAFLYSNESLIPIYNRGMLQIVATELGMKNVQRVRTIDIQRYLLDKKGDKDLYAFYDELLKIIDSKNKVNSFEEIKAAIIEKLEDNDRFVARRSGKDYIWIGTKDGLIGHDACHYEIVNDTNKRAGHSKSTVFVELHHEGKFTKPFKELQSIEGVKHFPWTVKGERINEAGWSIEGRSVDELTNILIQALYELDDVIGEKAREIIRNKSDMNNTASKDNKQYWLYSPGEYAKMWNDCVNNGIMCLGWDELGDFQYYKTRDDMRKKMATLWGPDNSYVNGSLATWQFLHDIKIGDFIIAKKGLTRIVGRGIVEGEYKYEPGRSEYIHTRKVRWTNVGDWETQGQQAMKTLTNITSFTDYVDELNRLIDGNKQTDNYTPELTQENYPPYSKEDFLDEVYVSYDNYEQLENLLLRKKNLILQGAPGVGKTFAARRLAYALMGEKDDSRVIQVQFHQNYSYEDFVMGYKPNEDGGFELKNGIFYRFCKRAAADREHKFFFIIDEINRGNLSKIFGELLMLIEDDYRDKPIQLSYKDEQFSVPDNLYLIGMMNTADRSLAMIDYALRRRFSFFEMKPGFENPAFKEYCSKLSDPQLNKLVNAIIELNKVIENDDSLGSGFCIGHSYLCNLKGSYNLSNIVEYDIIPMLREYWFDNNDRFNQEAQKLRDSLK